MWSALTPVYTARASLREVACRSEYQFRLCVLPRKAVMASITRGEGGMADSFQSSFRGTVPSGSREIADRDDTAS